MFFCWRQGLDNRSRRPCRLDSSHLLFILLVKGLSFVEQLSASVPEVLLGVASLLALVFLSVLLPFLLFFVCWHPFYFYLKAGQEAVPKVVQQPTLLRVLIIEFALYLMPHPRLS